MESSIKNMGDLSLNKIDCQTFENIDYKNHKKDIDLLQDLIQSDKRQ